MEKEKKEMRMWMVNPVIMCQKHICGEHLECHMFLGAMRKNKKLNGYFTSNCFEPEKLQNRHDAIAYEMIIRGYKHKSDMIVTNEDLENYINIGKVDVDKSLHDLLCRCKECFTNSMGI